MHNHRNPQASVSKEASSDNFNPGDAIELLYSELVEVEALAVARNQRHEHAASAARIVGHLGNPHLIAVPAYMVRSMVLHDHVTTQDGASALVALTAPSTNRTHSLRVDDATHARVRPHLPTLSYQRQPVGAGLPMTAVEQVRADDRQARSLAGGAS